MAFAALPTDMQGRYFREDSACHEEDLLEWLRHADRAKEPGGAIGFAVSAVMSKEFGATFTGDDEPAVRQAGNIVGFQ
jgi:hypothetical protein